MTTSRFTDEQIDHLTDRFHQLMAELTSVYDEMARRAKQAREDARTDGGLGGN